MTRKTVTTLSQPTKRRFNRSRTDQSIELQSPYVACAAQEQGIAMGTKVEMSISNTAAKGNKVSSCAIRTSDEACEIQAAKQQQECDLLFNLKIPVFQNSWHLSAVPLSASYKQDISFLAKCFHFVLWEGGSSYIHWEEQRTLLRNKTNGQERQRTAFV